MLSILTEFTLTHICLQCDTPFFLEDLLPIENKNDSHILRNKSELLAFLEMAFPQRRLINI